jgi:cell division septation protein DedD
MATDPDPEEFIEEDEQDELARRSIFSAGWFRALLVLTVLAIIVVVSLPYLLNWLEPTPGPPGKPQAKVSEPAPPPTAPPATTPAPAPPAPAVTPSPSAPVPPAKAEAPAAPPAKPDAPATAQAPAAPSPADRPVGTAPLPAVPAPAPPPAKTAPAAKAETPKAPSAAKKSAPVEAGQGGYWVQVGAFAEERNAEALSKQLKGENFPVTISRISRGGSAPATAKAPSSAAPAAGGQNQLFITGSTPEAVNAALKGKGTAQPVKGGLVVNPPFDLETAMSLSSSLKKEGFKVVIRRAKAAPAPTASPSDGAGGTVFHVVRVGGYPDRAKAQQVRGELEAKGHPGFLMQGSAR